jgi:hypothetical protein
MQKNYIEFDNKTYLEEMNKITIKKSFFFHFLY